MSDDDSRPQEVVDPPEFRRLRNSGPMSNPPETAGLTHGGYARGPLHCDVCAVAEYCAEHRPGAICARDEEYTADRRRLLAQALLVRGGDCELHGALIERAVMAGVIIERMQRYLAVFGDVERKQLARGIVKQQPGTDLLLKAIAVERQALEALNLTPEAMVKVGVPGDPPPAAPGGLRVLDEDGVRDADFEEPTDLVPVSWIDQMMALMEKEELEAGEAGEELEDVEGVEGGEELEDLEEVEELEELEDLEGEGDDEGERGELPVTDDRPGQMRWWSP